MAMVLFVCALKSFSGTARRSHGQLCATPSQRVGGTAPAFQMQWAECLCSLICYRRNTPGDSAVPLRTQLNWAAL